MTQYTWRNINMGLGLRRRLRLAKGALRALFASPAERRHSLVGPPELWKLKRDFQIAYLKAAGLQPAHYLLDLGCGTLRGGVPIIEYLEPEHYYGVESREDVLDEGRKELRDSGLEQKAPKLVAASDIATVSLGRTFDYIWAFSVLIHMTDDIAATAFDFIGKHLAADGLFLANVYIGERPGGSWQGFPVVWRPLDFYHGLAARAGLVVDVVGTLGELGHQTGTFQDQGLMLRVTQGK